MRISNLFPFVLSAGAILIPSSAKDSVGYVEKLPLGTQSGDVTIKCVGGCPVALAPRTGSGLPTKWTRLYPADLHATIEVKDNTVVWNTEQIWPPRAMQKTLAVTQSTKGTIYPPFEGLIPVSTSLEYKKDEILADAATMMKIHRVDIEILAIIDAVVHTETIGIRVAETEHGLALLPAITRSYVPSPYTDKCTTIWCRVSGTIAQKFDEWRAAASQKIKKWRGCGGNKNVHKIGGLPIKGGPAKFGPGSSLNPNRNQEQHKTLGHHRHHRQHQGGLRRFLTYAFETFIFPTIFGLSVGLIVGAISFLFVSAIRRLRNRGQAEYIVVEQVEVEEGLAGLPKYEELYREPQAESEDEKKELLQ